MKRLLVLTCLLLISFETAYLQQNPSPLHGVAADPRQMGFMEQAGGDATGTVSQQHCTLIYASDDSTALAGSNEDWTYHFDDIWFLPPEKGKHGRAYWGYNFDGERVPQGGMNDQGLFYDGASAEDVTLPPDTTKPRFDGDLILKAMEECSRVEEVIALYEHYARSDNWSGQLLVGDRFGNSAIIEATGSIIKKKGTYQIATNFYQSRVDPEDITDTRYRLADTIFGETENISIDLFRRILSVTHWEEYRGSLTVTLYTCICDLKKGDIYLYYFHNFENVVKIHLQDELEKGENYYPIPSLFPYDNFAAAIHRSQWTVNFLYDRALENGLDGDKGAMVLFRRMKRGDFKDYRLRVAEGHLLALGYKLAENDNSELAVQTFEHAVQEYPKSTRAYNILADAYLRVGDTLKAIGTYKKSLELNPENDVATQALEALDKK